MKQKKNRFLRWWNQLHKIPRRFVITFITIAMAMGSYYLWQHTKMSGDTNMAVLFFSIMKATTGVSYLRLLDDFLYTRINTEKLLSENAIAYAIYIFSFALVIAMSFGM